MGQELDLTQAKKSSYCKETEGIIEKVEGIIKRFEDLFEEFENELEEPENNVAIPFKLSSKEYNKVGLSIIETVNNTILDGDKHNIKKMIIMVVAKRNDQFIDIMRDYGEGFDSVIINNPTFFNNISKISRYGLVTTKVCPNDFGLKNNVEVTLAFYL